MSGWPAGRAQVLAFLDSGRLERIAADPGTAVTWLDRAERHLASVLAIPPNDPDGAFVLLYDAARMSIVALLEAQGLRASRRGGHYVLEETIAAQFSAPPHGPALRPYGRLRRRRNAIEYDAAAVTLDEVRTEHAKVVALHQAARALLPTLDPFD